MNIAIITVYQPFTNLGSFLQAYALKTFLEKAGHNVRFVKTGSSYESIKKLITSVRPFRSYFLRIKKAIISLVDLKRLSFVDYNDKSIDCYIWGSDEIWNITNRFFCRPIFFGNGIINKAKIGYAISAGHASEEDFQSNFALTEGIKDFRRIFCRDIHTKLLLQKCFNIETDGVIDPTLLITNAELSRKISVPKQNYLLVYTYGIDNEMVKILKTFAAQNKLKIISPCFWHLWADKTIECSALEFSTLIANAEYVFTTTFHGAVFSLINHSKCCILPLRPKVKDLCNALGCNDRLISSNCGIEEFERVISAPFDITGFESNLEKLRKRSASLLLSELYKIENENIH